MRLKTAKIGVLIVGLVSLTVYAQSMSYKVVPGWPKMPAGMYFGRKAGIPLAGPPSGPPSRVTTPKGRTLIPARPEIVGETEGNGLGGIAIDDQDRIWGFNRGAKTMIVFDRDGNFVKAAGGGPLNGVPMDAGMSHSGEIDWQGNVWIVDRARHRVMKLDSTLEKAVLQIGTTDVPGVGPDHLNRPSGVSITHKGDILITDGYGNNRVLLYTKDGKFIKQSAKGAGGPDDQGTGPGEFSDPHQAAIDSTDHIYVADRGNKRVQVFDNQLNFQREFKYPTASLWDIAISRKGDDGFGFIADKTSETVWKFSLKDGTVVAKLGGKGRGPGEFDGAHGLAIDSRGAVYVADTNGQRLQKFEPVAGGTVRR